MQIILFILKNVKILIKISKNTEASKQQIRKEQNLYYVALTRGKEKIILDTKIPLYDDKKDNKKQVFFKKVGKNSIEII